MKRIMLRKSLFTLTAVASLITANYAAPAAQAAGLSEEEPALARKGDVVETYRPTEPNSHQIGKIRAVNGNGRSVRVLILNFGREAALAAREEGRSMAAFRYTPAMAHQFLFAQGWDKYHDRFFTRAYVQKGLAGYYGGR